ncbi:acetyltransferase [Campylobacter concisus]|uniref:acetyltransferase n=1 Tax=Campylobacter concisus TaxID=199 RepID=UPI0018FFA87E|nr:acetyltransferase [Campylobacter concisus]
MKSKDMTSGIYIVGTGGFASEVAEYILDNDEYKINGYFDIKEDDYKKYKYVAPFLGDEQNYNFSKGDNVTIAISDHKLRNKIYMFLKNKGVNFPNIVHRSSFISKSSFVGEGSLICPFVSITSNASIGKNFQANIYSYVAHDCIIGSNVTFAPSVKCNGNVIIEDDVYIGTGAIIHQGKHNRPLRIGRGVVIAAGSVVTKSIEAGKTVFGNPAIEFTKENIKRRS